MALKKRGKWRYGEGPSDVRAELVRYGTLADDVPTEFADARCVCGGAIFRLSMDERAGVAVRICKSCQQSHAMADSEEFLSDAALEEYACPCGGEAFEITVGVHLYDDSIDVRWLYVGCRCSLCGLTAVYGDWKNEALDYKQLLSRV